MKSTSNSVDVKSGQVTRFLRITGIPLSLLAFLVMAGCPTPDRTPPANVAQFTATAGNGQVALTWKNPADEDFAGTRVLRKEGSYPVSVTDGVTVSDGVAEAATDTGLTNGVTYYYAAYAYDKVPNYGSGAQAVAIPTAPGADEEVLDQYEQAKNFLDGVPDGAFPPDEAQDLEDALWGSESLYRAGDPCGAAAALQEFAALAQGVRQGGAAGTAEELYNLGRMLRYDMLIPPAAKATCPGADRIGVEAVAVPDSQNNDNTRCQAAYSFGEPRLLTVEGDGEIFTQVIVPGAESELGAVGEPAVPMLRRLVAVPEGATVEVEATPFTAELFACNPYPYQQPIIAGSNQIYPFAKNDAAYKAGGLYPPEPVIVTEIGQLRDVRLVQIEIASGQYNSATSELTLFSNVDVAITFHGGSGNFVTEPGATGFELGVEVNPSVLNGVLTRQHAGPRPFPPSELGEEFLVLTHPTFHDAAVRLATWKNTKGIVTNVFDVCDGAGSGPDTSDAIKQFIRNRFNTMRIRVSYVLLLGDSEFIPVFSPNHHFAFADYGCSTIGSDWFYATRADTDMLPSFAVGRIPIDTLDQANTVVDKVIGYEQNPPNNNTFYSTASLVSYFECCRRNIAQDGAEAMGFISDTEWDVRNLRAHGYTAERLYTETVNAAYVGTVPPYRDTTPRSLRGGAETMPADIAPASGFTWNSTATNIVNAFNSGRFFIMYVDHGDVNGWSNPSFTSDHVTNDLNNNGLLPVVFSICCQSGNFDNEVNTYVNGTAPSGVYFAERLIRRANSGACGVIAATRNSMLAMYLFLQKGFADAIWPDSVLTTGDVEGLSQSMKRLGNILNYGKTYMVSQASAEPYSNKNDFIWDSLYVWHVIGDPTLEMWTANPWRTALPAGLTVENDAAHQRLIVHYAVENAVITGFQSNEPIGRGSVIGGVAYLPYLNEEPSEILGIDFVVSVRDHVPFTVTAYLPDTIPPWPVSNLNAIPGNAQVALTWENPGADFAKVKVFRTLGAPVTEPPALPELLRYEGAAETFTDTLVNNGTEYCYTVFAYDAAGNWSTPVSACATPSIPDVTPPGDVTQLTAIPGDGTVGLSWKNPSDADFSYVVVKRGEKDCPAAPDDGIEVYQGSGKSCTDINVSNDTAYCYSVFSFDTSGLHSTGVQASATPHDAYPPADIVNFSAVPAGPGEVVLSWENPADNDYAGVVIRRKTGAFPTSPTDGDGVYDGASLTYMDTELAEGQTYYYTAFAYDEVPNFAPGVQAQATVTDTTPPGNVLDFSAWGEKGFVSFMWVNPGDTDFAGVRIQRGDQQYPASPGEGITVYDGTATDTTDTNVVSGTTYYYTAFAYDNALNFASGAQAEATPAK